MHEFYKTLNNATAKLKAQDYVVSCCLQLRTGLPFLCDQHSQAKVQQSTVRSIDQAQGTKVVTTNSATGGCGLSQAK